jgi:hypothetical protein
MPRRTANTETESENPPAAPEEDPPGAHPPGPEERAAAEQSEGSPPPTSPPPPPSSPTPDAGAPSITEQIESAQRKIRDDEKHQQEHAQLTEKIEAAAKPEVAEESPKGWIDRLGLRWGR